MTSWPPPGPSPTWRTGCSRPPRATSRRSPTRTSISPPEGPPGAVSSADPALPAGIPQRWSSPSRSSASGVPGSPPEAPAGVHHHRAGRPAHHRAGGAAQVRNALVGGGAGEHEQVGLLRGVDQRPRRLGVPDLDRDRDLRVLRPEVRDERLEGSSACVRRLSSATRAAMMSS